MSDALEGLRPVFFGPSEQVWEISLSPERAFSTVRIVRQRAAVNREISDPRPGACGTASGRPGAERGSSAAPRGVR